MFCLDENLKHEVLNMLEHIQNGDNIFLVASTLAMSDFQRLPMST